MVDFPTFPTNLLDLLASAIVIDEDDHASLNLQLLQSNCEDTDNYINCNNNHIPADTILSSIIGENNCGNSAIAVNLPVSDENFYLSDIKIGNIDGHTLFTSGHQTMVGEARPWRDELGDALSIKVQGAGISTDLAENVVNFDYNAVYNVNPSIADFLYKNVQLNHDRDMASTIDPHIHWLQEKDYSPNFLLQYRWLINGGEKTTAWTFLRCNLLTFPYTVGQVIHQISHATSAIVPPAGTQLSDIIQFRIYRDTTNAAAQFTGTCPYNTGGNASAWVMSFDLHFQINSLGSDEEYVK